MLQPKRTYYFTYGTSKNYPFQGGWTEITAPSMQIATCYFKNILHPKDDSTDNIINCADIYDESVFQATDMYKNQSNCGAGCHEKIDIAVTHCFM